MGLRRPVGVAFLPHSERMINANCFIVAANKVDIFQVRRLTNKSTTITCCCLFHLTRW